MQRFERTDIDGSHLLVEDATAEEYAGGLYVRSDGAWLSRENTLALYEALGDHLAATQLDVDHEQAVLEADATPACCTGEDSPCYPEPELPQTILEDAQAAVYGDRQADYGHPREDMTRQAIIWTGLLHHKLADGAHLEPEDVARCMVGVKLARDVNAPKRDNRVDGAGYFLCLDRLETGQ